ncbi:MAG: flagellar basal body-associated protein FliL [Candidatus Melainabacteria bacterium]
MARPTKPKDIKPKAEVDAAAPGAAAAPKSGGLDLKFIITLVAIVLCTTATSAASVYFLAPMVITPAIVEKLPQGEEDGHGGGGHDEGPKIGMNMELDEFMVNLKVDPNLGGNQYLRAKMSLSIMDKEENCYDLKEGHAMLMPEGEGKVVGAAVSIQGIRHTTISTPDHRVDRQTLANGAPAASPFDTCMGHFKENMGKYTPTIRDVVNSALMKRTAGTLSSVEGQESLKDEIKEEINQLLEARFEVVRVNFEDFIIQR